MSYRTSGVIDTSKAAPAVSMTQLVLFDEKTRGRKSRDTVSREFEALLLFHCIVHTFLSDMEHIYVFEKIRFCS
jgi:hypothetical protein